MPFGSQNSTDGLGIQAPAHEEILRTGSAWTVRPFWYVINCHTRRLASKAKFKSRSAAEARRAQLQAKFERQAVLRFLSWGEK
jgi:hypothetical protein